MAKLTKVQTRTLEHILGHLRRGQAYLDREDIAVALKNRPATTTLHFTRADGATLYEITKDIGSDLTGFRWAATMLEQFLQPPRKDEPCSETE